MENWSAFPSDNAAFFFALAYGLSYLSRRLAIPVGLYTAVFICLPRMYFGIHYASDIVIGAVIGVAVVWVSLRTKLLDYSGLTEWLLASEKAKPCVFYAIAYLVSFEIGELFDEVRNVVRAVRGLVSNSELAALAFILIAIAAISSLMLFRSAMRRRVENHAVLDAGG